MATTSALSPTPSDAAMSVKTPAAVTSGSSTFFDGSREGRIARTIYLRIFLGGIFMIFLLIFSILSIFWGSLWKVPAHDLHGWIVDFDGGVIGQNVIGALNTPSNGLPISWAVVSPSKFPGGSLEVGSAVLEEHAWVAITINAGSSTRLSQSLRSPNTTYNGADAITVFGVEARNDNVYRTIIHPLLQTTMDVISQKFAIQTAQQAANSTNLATLLAQSPQTITAPISYNIVNLAPFDIPVATAVTLVGLIYQVILSFFVVMIAQGARDASGLSRRLNTRSLIIMRVASSFGAYFLISLCYALLSLAFQLDFSRKFGHSGFLVFWMVNYVGMLALGLALESLVTLLTPRFIPFFMLTWIITNVAVCIFPIEVLPVFYRYGYAMPFYNLTRAMRTIVFGTKNRVGFNFGILLIWIAISLVSLPLIQVYVRRTRPQPPPMGAMNPANQTMGEKKIPA